MTRTQRPNNPDNWLYRDLYNKDGSFTRLFTKVAHLGCNDTDLPECTNDDKLAWEAAHPEPEPEPAEAAE